MNRYTANVLPTEACQDCATLTVWSCMQCQRPTCPTCSSSMHAMCQACRNGYVGPIYDLGPRADAYIRTEFERLFR